MRIRAIIHQQICQLRWHLLACLGLIMVLPIEEAVVSFRGGDGFHSVALAVAALTFSPLLAGLIACANVQGDLNEKRYIFWRSKPVSVKKLMALKFIVGLILSLAIVACPLIFAVVTTTLCGKDLDDASLKYSAPVVVMIAAMTYSLCFGCNVIVRNTARSWLIGMLLAGFMLVLPFMLPLGFKDITSDIESWALGFYSATIFVTSAAAFVFALYAAEHDWHLKTNLRELLCVGAALVFVLLMLFSSQVANIRVLDELEVEVQGWGGGTLEEAGNRLIFQGQDYVDVGRKGISLHKIGSHGASAANRPVYGNIGMDSEGRQVIYGPKVKGYKVRSYPRRPNALYMNTENGTYYFGIISYFRKDGKGRQAKNIYEKICLRSYKLVGDSWRAVDELDMTDCLTDRTDFLRMAMRLIDNTLVACVNNSFVAVDITDPQKLKQIDKKLDGLAGGSMQLGYENRQNDISIPLVPVEGISIEERIRFSIDLRYRFRYHDNEIYKYSIVDIHDGTISFFSASDRDVARFDVTGWDDENVYCKFTAARPFTILESMARSHGAFHNRTFVKDQKLYVKDEGQVMVFDARSKRRIRKLGHFVRMDCRIEDVAVLEDGKLLLSARWHNVLGEKNSNGEKTYLYLLENPE